MEQRLPRRLFTVSTAVCLVFAFMAGTGTASADISLGGVSPTWASTRGGPVIFFNISSASSFTAMIDGVPVSYVVNPAGAPNDYVFTPPPHAPGPVLFTVRGNDGTTASITITYVELPAIGLASPVERVSVMDDGTEGTHRGNGAQGSMMLGGATSGDGRYVMFFSETDLGFGPISQFLPFAYRPLIKDRHTGALTSAQSGHSTCDEFCGSPSMSLDGSIVAYVRDIFDPVNERHVVIVRAPFPASYEAIDVDRDGAFRPGNSGVAMLSGDGTAIAFTTTANLDGDSQDSGTSTTPGTSADLFVRVLASRRTERWTTNAAVTSLSVSGNGRLVAFTTAADLVGSGDSFSDVFVLDRDASAPANPIRQLTYGSAPSTGVKISSNGEVVAFTSAAELDEFMFDTNGVNDVYRAFTNPAYSSVGPERVSFGRDQAGLPIEFSAPSSLLSISGDGRRVTFATASPGARENLPAELGSPTFAYLAQYGSPVPPQLIAADNQGVPGDYLFNGGAALTPDGQYSLFTSLATNLVADDSNALFDVFAKQLPPDDMRPHAPVLPLDLRTGGTPVSLTFMDGVTQPGHTSLTTSTHGPAPSHGFSLGSPAIYYDLSTTTLFSGMISICITYDPSAFSSESNLRLLHHDGSVWVDITLHTNSDFDLVCGLTSSLSPFVVAKGPTSPPVLSSVPLDQVLEATGPAGGTSTWSIPTAIDGADAPVPVTCAPASGSTFPLGITTVTCSATDIYGNQAAADFTVTIRDTTAPTLSLPANITAAATNPSGASVTFAASANDVVDLSVPIQCAPESGASFAIGTTVVQCTASDTAGNIAAGTFQVTIISATGSGHMVGAGLIIQGDMRHQFNFDVARGLEHSSGRFELRIDDARSCRHGDCGDRSGDRQGQGDRRDPMLFSATALTSVAFSDDPAVDPGYRPSVLVDTVRIAGIGKWNGRSGYTFEVTASDSGEPGRSQDTLSLIVRNANGEIVAQVAGTLDGGNIQSTNAR